MIEKGPTERLPDSHTHFGAHFRRYLKNIYARVGIVPMNAILESYLTIKRVCTYSEMYSVS